jgi:hypothetical protein
MAIQPIRLIHSLIISLPLGLLRGLCRFRTARDGGKRLGDGLCGHVKCRRPTPEASNAA